MITSSRPADSDAPSGLATAPSTGGPWPLLYSLFGSTATWLLVGAAFALFSAWLFRFSLNPDGVVYLDMAEGALRDGPARLLNACWGGLYPALMALLFGLLHPSGAETKIALVHLLNAFLLLVSFAAFLRLVRRLAPRENSAGRAAIVALSAVFFLWLVAGVSCIRSVTPDLCGCVLFFWAASLVLDIYAGARATWFAHAALGVAIGLAYYVKQAMLPVGGLLLLILLVMPPHVPRARRKLACSAAVFVAVALPFIAWLSAQTGRLSLSENGRLNYLWHVENIPMVPFDGASYQAYLRSRPLLTPRVLADKPLAVSFEEAAEGTYPLLYNPAAWFVGVQPRFNLKRQLVTVLVNLRASLIFLLEFRHVWLGLLILVAFSFPGFRYWTIAPGSSRLILWCLATCIALNAVHIERRYMFPFVAVAVASGYAAVARNQDSRFYRALFFTLAVALLLPSTEDFVAIKSDLHEAFGGTRPDYLRVADELKAKGLRSGGKIAVVGFASDAYYAKAVGAQILVQLPDEKSFRSMTTPEMENLRARLLRSGVTMIVAPAGSCTPWLPSDQRAESGSCILALDKPSGADR
jgi:hypothetical protein